MTDKPIQWMPLDRQDENHISHFKALFRPMLENTIFSLQQITDQDLVAPLLMPHNLPYFAVREGKDAMQLLGMVVFFKVNWIDRSAELGGSVAKEYLNSGVGVRNVQGAIRLGREELNLRRIYMNVLDGSAGHRTAEASGMKLEGTMRGARLVKGEYRDAHVYAWVEGDDDGDGRTGP